jgi:hypothetical protein
MRPITPRSFSMVTYVYETLPRAGKTVRRYEIQQSIKDAPLTKHPTTGEPIRRCIVLGPADPFVRAATLERPAPRSAKREREHHDHHHHDDHHHH